MRQIDLTFDTLGARAIPVGYQGDNLALQVAIDCTDVLALYPNAMPHIVVTDPEGNQHEDRAWMRDGILLWQVRSVDTALAGSGDVRVNFMDTEEDAVLRTAHAAIVILELADADDEIPTQLANWMAQAGITLTELKQAMAAIDVMEASTDQATAAANAAAARLNNIDAQAETLTAGSSATASVTEANDHLRLLLGIPRGADGQDGQNGQDGADGQNGVSPTVSVSAITGGHRVSITDANGLTTIDVMDGTDGEDGQDGSDGTDGEDGVSPSVTVTEITGGHTVAITDAEGTSTFDVMDGAAGQDGAPGQDGDPGPAGPGVPTGGTTGQVLKKASGTDYDTEWADESGDYTDLTNKPQINSVTLNGNKSLSDLGIASAADVAAKYTKPSGGIPDSDIASASTWNGKYAKPSGGIPSTDLASAVQTSLGKADTAYQKPSGGIPSTDLASGVIPDITGKLDKPSTAGTSGQVLTSDGQGGQSWEDPQGGGTVDDTLSISGEAADAAKVGEVKADLESDISDLSLRLDRYYPPFTLGALDVSNGGEASATNRMRTGFLPTKNAVALVALEYKVYVIYYDKYRHFAANGGGWVSGVAAINQAYPYFRLLIANDNINNFTNKTENRTIVTIDTTAMSVDDRIDTLQSYVNGYYPAIFVAMMNVTNGGINFDYVTRATSEIVSGKYRYITAARGYSYYICYYNSSLTFVKNSGGWKTGTNELEEYPYIRLLFKNDSISDWTGLTNTFCYLEIEKSNKQHVYTIGQNDNVAQVLTEAMKYRGSVVYIEPYEHDCIAEWQTFYGSTYFSSMSSGEGLGLSNDIHIIGRSGHKLKCWYTGSNNYVMEHFSLFNNPHGGSGYTLENVCIDVKKIRYAVHDERGSDTVPYKVRIKHCFMSQDQTGSTWDRSRACIGGGLGMSADVVVEDCICKTVTSSEHLDSIAYHNSDANGSAANAQSNLVIKNCYCAGDSTIQLMHHGASTRKTPVLVVNCSLGSAMEIIDNQSGTNNLEIYQINNEIRT